MLDETPRSPDWWLLRLGRRLRDRQGQLTEWRDFFKGEPPLPVPPKGLKDAHRRFQEIARTNICGLISNSSVNRLTVTGIAGPDGEPDEVAWRWWKDNRLPARQKQLYRSALSQSVAYVVVGPHPRDPRRPLITLDHPRTTILERDPATGEVVAALRAWHDDVEGVGRAVVQTPEWIVRYETTKPLSSRQKMPWGLESWQVRHRKDGGRSGIEVNPWGAVTIVPFSCMPQLGEAPEPEFAQAMGIQERLNLSILNRMTAGRYSAYKQKWVKGHKFTRAIDPATGLEILDPVTGQPKVEQPFTPGPDTVWASEGENTQFGEFGQIDLTMFLKEHEADIVSALLVTSTPAYYWLSSLVNISADTVTALDLQHIAKVNEHISNFGESWEMVNRLAGLIAQEERDLTEAEVRWRDPRQLNPAVVVDAAIKKKSLGYPLSVIAEDMDEPPARVKRITSQSAGDQLLAAALSNRTRGENTTVADG
ncbi:phage portal protein [Nocardiopsis exhalans]|uniref:Phage portal protein n=1 Tax=Nocardiopsis exhalans TaxID=163604 RepID=A0ABY5DEY7_9ACTN|nr:phage portal protein [Nocardiopsis exhalans]USY21758.1 phage portal protein [Nocardiopsis exhalans]